MKKLRATHSEKLLMTQSRYSKPRQDLKLIPKGCSIARNGSQVGFTEENCIGRKAFDYFCAERSIAPVARLTTVRIVEFNESVKLMQA